MRDVTLLYFDGCPSWETTARRLDGLASELDLRVRRVRVDTDDDVERWRFRGSPTVVVDGRDPFAAGDEPVGMSCRIYQTPDGPTGSPTIEQLRAALS